jgi:hypothetical protein
MRWNIILVFRVRLVRIETCRQTCKVTYKNKMHLLATKFTSILFQSLHFLSVLHPQMPSSSLALNSSAISRFHSAIILIIPNRIPRVPFKIQTLLFLRVLFRAFSVIIAIVFQHMHNFFTSLLLIPAYMFRPLRAIRASQITKVID